MKRSKLESILCRETVPERIPYLELVERTIRVLESEDASVRPPDGNGLPGGLVRLRDPVPSIIIPDLHARPDFVLAILGMPFSTCSDRIMAVLEALENGLVSLVFLGDGFHSERRGMYRWLESFAEYSRGLILSKPMGDEMRESLSAMELVMECKCAFPELVHFLKGNHENVLNEEGHGNHPFGKFAMEGRMVRDFILERYGEDFLASYAHFEKSLPVCLVGTRFMASHAEPAAAYSEREIVCARDFPDVVEGLTWTANGAAGEGSVARLLASFLPDVPDALYFGGHRAVTGAYALRAGNRFVQIHNPDMRRVAVVPPDRPFDFCNDFRSA